MRGTTAKRIRKNVAKRNEKVLVEVASYCGADKTRTFVDPKQIYKAAKDAYKNYRINGKHEKANLFIV